MKAVVYGCRTFVMLEQAMIDILGVFRTVGFVTVLLGGVVTTILFFYAARRRPTSFTMFPKRPLLPVKQISQPARLPIPSLPRMRASEPKQF